MQKVMDKMKYAHLFEAYTHSRAVIYSALENQYDSCLYVDDIEKPSFAILFTAFDFHYVGGDREDSGVVEALRQVIFQAYLPQNDNKEAIVIGPDGRWDSVLQNVFSGYSDIVDSRLFFYLDHTRFNSVRESDQNVLDLESGMAIKINNEENLGSSFPYPVCRVMDGDTELSYCAGFMLGKGHAEIDVKTHEQHRRKGYAKAAAVGLIAELLSRGIEPDWCCWEQKVASRKLAESIGFEQQCEIKAYIWVEEA